MSYTLASLFDGAGTVPFAAQICGIEPIWSSEIEPFPCSVTEKRFPEMVNLGDVTKIDGRQTWPVDVITFGSPCQDLSVAGRQAGLDGERSSLFLDAIRIIKEMREVTNGCYPSIAVWENVPGAFSSNKGEDFRRVLEEFVRIKDGEAAVPRPPKGKWADAGEIVGDGYSVAWRVLDAQYWGVPQRRRRIYLVAEFRGGRAGEILFEREGLARSFAAWRETWKGITKPLAFGAGTEGVEWDGTPTSPTLTANNAGGNQRMPDKDNFNCVIQAVKVYDARGNGDGENAPTITGDHENRITDYTGVVLCAAFMGGQGIKAGGIAYSEEIAPTLRSVMSGSNTVPDVVVMATQQGGAETAIDLCPTITAAAGMSGNNQPVTAYCVDMGGGKSSAGVSEEQSPTLACTHGGAPAVCVGERCGCEGVGKGLLIQTEQSGALAAHNDQFILYVLRDDELVELYMLDRASFNQGENAKYQFEIAPDGAASPRVTRGPSAVFYATPVKLVLRRLMPTEAARLQGMPDWWCDDVPHSDTAEYKMWGNGMALPNVLYVMEGIKKYLEERDK